MLDIPESIKNLYKQDRIYKKFKISFYNSKIDSLYPYETLFPDTALYPAERGTPYLVIENERLISESVKLTESLCDSDNIIFGSCEAAQFEFECVDVIEDISNKEIVVTQIINNEYEIPFGIYTIESAKKQNDKRRKKVIAYDRMCLFDIDVSDWYNSLALPMTLKQFRDSLCLHIGVEQAEIVLINDDMQITKTIDPQQMSGRDVLKAICEINGCFGHFERTGILKYINLPVTGLYPSETLYPQEDLLPADSINSDTIITTHYKSIDYEEYLVKAIDKLQIRQEEGDIGTVVGEGTNGYVVEGNFLVFGKSAAELLTIANKLYANIKDRIYRPYTAQTKGLPYIEVGDLLTLITKNDIIETFIFKRTLSGLQGLTDEFKAEGEEYQSESFGINKSIIQLQGKTNVLIRNVEELSSTITDVEAGLESKIQQTADAINLNVKNTKEGLESQISQTASSLTTQITDTNNRLDSSITQTASSISTLINLTDDLELGLASAQSSIDQNAYNIGLKVSSSDYNGNSIVSLINIGTDGIQIDASKIDLNGFVTFSNLGALGQTTINGGVFTSPTINGGTINIDTDAIIGDSIYLGEQNSPATKGIYFSQKSFIETTNGFLKLEGGNDCRIIADDLKLYSSYGEAIVLSEDLIKVTAVNFTWGNDTIATQSWVQNNAVAKFG